MNERPVKPTEDTKKRQREAGDPSKSVWVSANAGSGKTHILTERVLRILLSGVPPENILCLTYTKAAAAEMEGRVAARLAKWAIWDDAELAEEIGDLAGTNPDADMLAHARRLFARALETPGGLKINTIHAFCESVLQRFPLEAGVPVGFAVLEEAEQQDMVRVARETVLAEGLAGHPEVGDAVATLFAALGDTSIEEAIKDALARSRQLRDVLADLAAARSNLAALLAVPETLNRTDVETKVLTEGRFGRAEAEAVLDLGDLAGATLPKKLDAIDWSAPTADMLFSAFLKKDGTQQANFPVKKFASAEPELAQLLQDEAARLEALYELRKAADILNVSGALVTVLKAVDTRYTAAKLLKNRLDFDDLIVRLVALLNVRTARDWVRYKLDSGITHILVDESQDTNPDQWQVVTRLTEEFFSGDGIDRAGRAVFAVGDEKQSIYSFQGADPALFAETGGQIKLKADASGQKFEKSLFRASFRTLDNILTAVDLVAEDPEVAAGLMLDEGYTGHESARTHKGGTVILWPLCVPEDDEPQAEDWPEEPLVHTKSPPNQLADRIVDEVQHWIAESRPLGQRERAVTADDVLILVQSRGPLFAAIIAALKRANLPTPGADRLSVTGHIVTADLLALADVLYNPEDSLTLAALLRSPLFDVSEELLQAIAMGREKSSLWSALQAHAKTDNAAAAAAEQFATWRKRLDFERPYEFFAHVLYAEGGLKSFHRRLGPEIDDVIAEFLDLALAHEQSAQPGLLGFIADMRAREITIKRELAESGDGVRVMTVHGAKGLEAPIVILADAATCRIKSGPVYLRTGTHPLLGFVPNKPANTEASASALLTPDEDAQKAEYWRRLYVGMTRAEDELYVTGFLNKNAKVDGTWYEKVEQALKPLSADVTLCSDENVIALRYPQVVPRPATIKTVPQTSVTPPEPLDITPLSAAKFIETLSPSRVETGQPTPGDPFATAARQSLDEDLIVLDPDLARRRGTALHALLQHLEKVPEHQRESVATLAVKVLLPDAPTLHDELAQKALDIYSGPHAGLLFGPDTRAELPFALSAMRRGKPVRIAGYIDRTIVTQTDVLLVDFKSDAEPAVTPDSVGSPYLTQLGLYTLAGKKLFPGLKIRAALFWTTSESLMEIPENLLDAAIAGFTLE